MKYECPRVSYCLLWQLVALIASLVRRSRHSLAAQLRTRTFSDAAAVLRRIHRFILAR